LAGRKKAPKETKLTESLSSSIKGMIENDASLGVTGDQLPTYKTGFDIFDYKNGCIDGEIPFIGLDGGKIITLIGKPGTGKSAAAVQLACGIAEQYENSQVIHHDFERATKKLRIMNLSKWSKEMYEEKYIYLDKDINTESVFKLIKAIYRIKSENFDALAIPSGMFDENGDETMVLPPTVIIIDSMITMRPKDLEGKEDLPTSMVASAVAKSNASFARDILGPVYSANIILIMVNHIMDKIDTNPMQRTQAQVNYLDQGETVPGGHTPIFLSNYIFKFVAGEKYKEDEGFGIKGFKSIIKMVKNRSTASGISFNMVFSQVNGFQNILSNYLYLKDNKLIDGAGRGFYLKSLPNFKFTQKEFLNKYYENEEFRNAFNEILFEHLADNIPVADANFSVEDSGEIELQFDGETGLYTDGNGNYYNDEGEPVEVEFESESTETE